MTVFCDTYDLKCLIKEPTCYKNPENPSCIDLILTKNPECFQSPSGVETDLSDFHRMTVTAIKTRGGSRTAATSKMERFVIIVNGFEPLTIITKRSILDVAAALDSPLKTTFKKFRPRIIHYMDYKNFQNDQYRDELTQKLSNIVSENNNIRLNEFLSICMDTLDQYAPCKQKYTRGNHVPFMNANISKEIMKRTRFRN